MVAAPVKTFSDLFVGKLVMCCIFYKMFSYMYSVYLVQQLMQRWMGGGSESPCGGFQSLCGGFESLMVVLSLCGGFVSLVVILSHL